MKHNKEYQDIKIKERTIKIRNNQPRQHKEKQISVEQQYSSDRHFEGQELFKNAAVVRMEELVKKGGKVVQRPFKLTPKKTINIEDLSEDNKKCEEEVIDL